MESTPGNSKPVLSYVLSAIAWLVSTGVGLPAIYYLFVAVIGVYARMGGTEKGTAGVLQYATVFIGAVVWLAGVIITGEYTLKHIGEPGVWKRFAWMIGIEVVIILIGAFVV